MRPKTFMVIAGEASGDILAAELVRALPSALAERETLFTTDYQPLRANLQPRFFGAGGAAMAAAGVHLAFDLTAHSVLGLSDVLKDFAKFRRLFNQLYEMALERQPDAVICVDFSGFNRRFAHAIKGYVQHHRGWFHPWAPKLIQYVSPQVWASRADRAYQVARDYDLLLSIFPFEKDWYAKRVPQLKVEFVGHPIFDRYANPPRSSECVASCHSPSGPFVVLLPGSRAGELVRHLPVMLGAFDKMRASIPNLRALIVLSNENLLRQARTAPMPTGVGIRSGGLSEALGEADLAIASTGTVTVEGAFFGVPTVALYKTSWTNYQIGKRLVRVKYLAMPNLLAEEEIFPEFVQNAATEDNIAQAALELLGNETRRQQIKAKLRQIILRLGEPGANLRAARAIAQIVENAP